MLEWKRSLPALGKFLQCSQRCLSVSSCNQALIFLITSSTSSIVTSEVPESFFWKSQIFFQTSGSAPHLFSFLKMRPHSSAAIFTQEMRYWSECTCFPDMVSTQHDLVITGSYFFIYQKSVKLTRNPIVMTMYLCSPRSGRAYTPQYLKPSTAGCTPASRVDPCRSHSARACPRQTRAVGLAPPRLCAKTRARRPTPLYTAPCA